MSNEYKELKYTLVTGILAKALLNESSVYTLYSVNTRISCSWLVVKNVIVVVVF